MKKFNEEHEWVEVNDGVASVGISKYAIDQLGDITFIELPEIDSDVSIGASVAFIESVKAASDIYTPLTGTIVEINQDLLNAPETLNADAENIWIFKIKLNDENELSSLMDGDSYAQYVNTL